MSFFSTAKNLCDEGKSLVLAMHSFATTELLLIRLRSVSDAHLRMRVEEVGSRLVKVLEVSKIRGATKSTATSSPLISSPRLA